LAIAARMPDPEMVPRARFWLGWAWFQEGNNSTVMVASQRTILTAAQRWEVAAARPASEGSGNPSEIAVAGERPGNERADPQREAH
jgi:hypothetical protein